MGDRDNEIDEAREYIRKAGYGVWVVMEQDPTLRLKAVQGELFKNRFFDVLWQTFLYQLNSALIGTEK